MPRPSVDRTQYYRDYYLRNKDIKRYQYYEKKQKQIDNAELYAPYGGEAAYYKMKYVEFSNLRPGDGNS